MRPVVLIWCLVSLGERQCMFVCRVHFAALGLKNVTTYPPNRYVSEVAFRHGFETVYTCPAPRNKILVHQTEN